MDRCLLCQVHARAGNIAVSKNESLFLSFLGAHSLLERVLGNPQIFLLLELLIRTWKRIGFSDRI